MVISFVTALGASARTLSAATRAIADLRSKKSIVIVAPHFNEERLKDGYYKRVKAIDDLLDDHFRLYVSYENWPAEIKYTRKSETSAVLEYHRENRAHCALVYSLMGMCGRVYCHSVWQAQRAFYRIPSLQVYVDVHGSVPEEETMYGKYMDAQHYSDIERVVVEKSAGMICVTDAMRKHFGKKYGVAYRSESIVLPIFNKLENNASVVAANKPLLKGKPAVAYAGGTMKWQKIELMQDAIVAMLDKAVFKICVPNPAEFFSTWSKGAHPNLVVASKTYKQLCEEVYPECHYGFVLRDDAIVNNVACPTKIAEYLQHDIVPILKTPNIGDFKALGMRYISVNEFMSGKLMQKDEYQAAVKRNREVFSRYVEMFDEGVASLRKMLGGEAVAACQAVELA